MVTDTVPMSHDFHMQLTYKLLVGSTSLVTPGDQRKVHGFTRAEESTSGESVVSDENSVVIHSFSHSDGYSTGDTVGFLIHLPCTTKGLHPTYTIYVTTSNMGVIMPRGGATAYCSRFVCLLLA